MKTFSYLVDRVSLPLNLGTFSPLSIHERRNILAAKTELAGLACLNQVEQGGNPSLSQLPASIRVVAWNLEEGRNWKKAVNLLQQHPRLRNADIILLTEVDLGLKRSGYSHVAKQIAQELGMQYTYGVEFLESIELMEKRFGPVDPRCAVGLHGNAILSRVPLHRPFLIRYPSQGKWWHSHGRVGGRMAIGGFVDLASGEEVVILCTHLESGLRPDDFRARRQQTGILNRILWQHFRGRRIIWGGDLNARPSWPEIQQLKASVVDLSLTNVLEAPTMHRKIKGKLVPMSYHIDYIFSWHMKVRSAPLVVPAIWPAGSGLDGYVSDHHVLAVDLA